MLIGIGGHGMEQLEIIRFYLFGEVKFLHLLVLLMAVDIVTGIIKASTKGDLWSRKAFFGYARKMMIFGIIILANVIDQILALSGAIVYSTVLFYIVNEGLSIVENLNEMGVKVPSIITDKLKNIEDKEKEEK
ncbi:putative holin; skin element [Brochothrix thermosphacta]|uniref:phage holin family protein n=1 Tax=Brochothrix thermosphacta TaxID=2756 RepID=UPI000D778372|nr:phage holin family protein [Brochothrix thermosphacta]SPN72409.1 putative holin; skin element [Brochothrix thermosphacta]